MSDLPDELIGEFALGALGVLTELRQLQQSLAAPGVVSRLAQLGHQLSGSAGSYGFPDVSKAAGRVEKSVADELPSRLAKLVAQLELVTKGLVATAPQSLPDPGPPEPAPAPVAASSKLVLFGEDDPMVVALVKDRLAREGFEVRHHVSGKDVLAAAAGDGISLIVLDAKLPGLDGFDILARLRKTEIHRHTPIMLLTALTGAHDAVRAFELGANDYVRKPFSPAELVARIKNLTRPSP